MGQRCEVSYARLTMLKDVRPSGSTVARGWLESLREPAIHTTHLVSLSRELIFTIDMDLCVHHTCGLYRKVAGRMCVPCAGYRKVAIFRARSVAHCREVDIYDRQVFLYRIAIVV